MVFSNKYTRAVISVLLLLVTVLYLSPILKSVHWYTLVSKHKYIARLINERGAGGTGFVLMVGNRPIIITNAHVCNLSQNGFLLLELNGTISIAKILKAFQINDLCAVEAPKKIRSGFDLAAFYYIHQNVYVIGHPLLEPTSITEGELSSSIKITMEIQYNPTVETCSGDGFRIQEYFDIEHITQGIMSVCLRTTSALSTTATVMPGSSGSPMVNMFGNVVGVVYAGNNARSYVVPLEELKQFIKEL